MTEWFCGFETGTIGHDTYPTPSATISTTSPRTGNFCALCSASGTGTATFAPGVPATSLPYNNTIIFATPFAFSFAFRPNTLPAASSEEIFTTQTYQVRIDNTGKLSLWTGSTPALQATGTTVLSTGIWYIIEAYYTGSNQSFRVYQSGHTPGPDEFSFNSSIGSSGIAFGKVTNRNGQTVSYSYDDIWAKDGVAGYLGESKTYLHTGSNYYPPTYDGFTKHPSGLTIWDCWHETPSIPSTYASSNTSALNKQTCKHDPVWPVGTTATLNAIKTCTTGNNGAAGAPTIQSIRIVGGVETDDTLNLSAGGVTTYWVTPWTSIPTIANLNFSEIGVLAQAGGSGETDIYECWLQICYSNLVLPAGGIGLGPAGAPIEFVIM